MSSMRAIPTQKTYTDRSIARASREVGRAFRRFAPAADDRAADLLVARVRSIDRDATDDEILHFLEVKARQAVGTRCITNLVGFLIWSVPQCFGGSMIEDYREAVRAQRDQERARWQEILQDPGADEEILGIARQELERLAGAARPGAQGAPEAARW